MYPVLNNNYVLLKQYKKSVLYPVNYNSFTNVQASGSIIFNTINNDAAKVLELCNGTNTIETIAANIKPGNMPYKEAIDVVTTFIELLEAGHYITRFNVPTPSFINTYGSFDTIYPFSVQFEVTKRCPLRCIHCFNNSGEPKTKELTKEEIFQIINKLKRMGIKKIMITGGEPSNREDFLDIIQYCSKSFMAVSVATNGYYITESVAKEAGKLKNVVFQVSLDGTREHHNIIRQNHESFDRAVKAIILLRKNRSRVVISTTFNRINYADAEYITHLSKKLGAFQITYSMTLDKGRAEDNNLNENVDIEWLSQTCKALKEKYEDMTFIVNFDTELKAGKENQCGMGYLYVCIRENGDVSPCIQSRLIRGNLLKQSPETLFHYTNVLPFKNLLRPTLVECIACEKIGDCLGCMAQAWEYSTEICEWKRKNIDSVNSIMRLCEEIN